MENANAYTLNCLRDEKEKLVEDVRRCDYCSTTMAEHSHCYEETAKTSGRRSKACFI